MYASKVITLLVIWIVGCSPESDSFTIEPKIYLESVTQFKNVQNKDSVIQLKIGYSDADGDIGLDESDTLPPFHFSGPYYHNLPITFLVKNSNGDFEELYDPNRNTPYGFQHERIPNLTPEGKYKSISGIVTVNIAANPFFTNPKHVKFEIQLLDRSLHKSNTIFTDILQLEH